MPDPTMPPSPGGARRVVALTRRLVAARLAQAVPNDVASDTLAGHVVVHGLSQVGRRVVEELVRLGETVVPAERPDRYDAAVAELRIPVVRADLRRDPGMRAVVLHTAKALVLCSDDDLGNLQVALAASRVNPRIRVVLRMFRMQLGQRIEQELPNLVTVSTSGLAAPAFVGAALRTDWRQRVVIRDREVLLDPGAAEPDGAHLPGRPDVPVRVQPTAKTGGRRPARWWSGVPTRVLRDLMLDRRMQVVVGLIGLVVGVSTVVFRLTTGLSWFGALYATVTEVATTGLDPQIGAAAGPVRAYAVVLLFAAAGLLAAVYALFTDALVSVRLTRALGGVPRRMRDHVVVCGLGAVGLRIAERLSTSGVPVAAVELREDDPLILSARRQGIAAVIGDARFPTTLNEVQGSRARAIVLATRDDLTNLEAALMVRREFPRARIVLRLYSGELAERAQRLVPEAAVLSTAALAAPSMAAAALGPEVVGTLEHENWLYVVVEARVEPNTAADGASVAQLQADGRIAVLGVERAGRVSWGAASTDRSTPLRAGDTIIGITAPGGLRDLLGLVRSGPQVADVLTGGVDAVESLPRGTD